MRFLLSGAFNTALTYALYLVALRYWDPRLAYTAVYIAGICLAYVLNRLFVFRSHAGWRSAVATPLIYLFQYLVSIAVVQVWISAGLAAWLAPLPALLLGVPLTYVLTRRSFTRP
jgi:putative flippase GtrA